MKKTSIFCPTAFLLLTAALFAVTAATGASVRPTAESTGPTEIVDETFREIDDRTFENLGWVGIRAQVPPGFEGTVYIAFRSVSGKMEIASVTAFEDYIGGIWLPTGTYTVSRVYDPDGMLIGICDGEERIQVKPEADAEISVSFVSNSDYVPPEWTGPSVSNSGAIPTPPTDPPTEPTTAPGSAPTEPITTPTEPDAESISSRILVSVLFTAGFFLLVIGIVFIFRWKRKKDEESY